MIELWRRGAYRIIREGKRLEVQRLGYATIGKTRLARWESVPPRYISELIDTLIKGVLHDENLEAIA